MSVSLYDDAILAKIKKWCPKDAENIKILKPNQSRRLFQLLLDENKDKPIQLPVVAISRDPSISIDIISRRSLSADGKHLKSNENETIQLNAIPMKISYQLDIYTRRYEEGDAYIRDFVFNMINHPKVVVCIPYNGADIVHTANIEIEPEITDNSDIAEKLFDDQFTRWTIRFKINDAFLFSVPVKQNARIGSIELEVQDPDTGEHTIDQVYPDPTEE